MTSRDLVALMAGRRVEQAFVRSERHRSAGPVLQVEELRGASLPERASLELYRGEVLGIAGLVGSGRTELLRAIFGLDVVRSGRVRVASFSGGATPARRLSQGVGLLSEDRKREGLAGNLSIAENVTLSKPMRSRFFGLISPSQQQRVAEHWIERLRIRAHGPSQVVRDLSGGNQQKVALARLLHHDIDVALLDEPTRGIDVGSRADIYRLIDDLACSGKAVLLVSSYFPELLGVADRIAVMHRGVLGPATPVTELDEHALIARAIGA